MIRDIVIDGYGDGVVEEDSYSHYDRGDGIGYGDGSGDGDGDGYGWGHGDPSEA